MENSLKGLVLAAGIIITCIIVSLGFYIAREANDTAAAGTGQINELTAEFSDANMSMYDGAQVSGSEVINVIRKFEGEGIGITVKNNKSKTPAYYYYEYNSDNQTLKKLESSQPYTTSTAATDNDYINPTGTFEGRVQRDDNGTIMAIEFTQV